MIKRITFKRIAAIIISILILFSIFAGNRIGVVKSKIETDARRTQQINDEWRSIEDTSYNISAILFYDAKNNNYTSSIYVRGGLFSVGYFFCYGGCSGAELKSIANYRNNLYHESAYLSMNTQNVYKAVGASKTYEIDANKPFALIIPNSEEPVTFINIYGNKVEVILNEF